MLVVARAFQEQALKVLRALPADQAGAEIPQARGFYAFRGDSVPEGFAFIAHVRDGEVQGVLCQKM